MVPIIEELFLLALDEEKGNILPFAKKTLAYGISGGILAELALLRKVCSNENHRLELVDATPTGDEILDEVLQEIQSSEKQRKLTYWVSQLSDRPKRLRERLGERLVGKDLLYQEDKHFFWKLPEGEDAAPAIPTRYEMKSTLRGMILSTAESNHRSLALLNIAASSELLGLIFTQDELPVAKRRIHEKLVRAALENPAMQTIEDIELAVSASLDDDDD